LPTRLTKDIANPDIGFRDLDLTLFRNYERKPNLFNQSLNLFELQPTLIDFIDRKLEYISTPNQSLIH
jgi:hypothetical protein